MTMSRRTRAALRTASAVAVCAAVTSTLAGCRNQNMTASTGSTATTPPVVTTTTPAPLVTLGGASPNVAVVGPGPTGPGGVPACTGGQIRQSLTGDGAGAGHIGDVLVFTNTGTAACALSGYPGATVAGPAGLRWNAARVLVGYMGGAVGDSNPPTVTLAPGGTASALLMWTDVDDPSAACQGSGYTSLLTTTPNTESTVTYQGSYTCENIQVTPVVPGSTGTVSQ